MKVEKSTAKRELWQKQCGRFKDMDYEGKWWSKR